MTLHIKTTEISQEWANKPIHGKLYRDINNTNVDKNASNKWFDRGELFRETETYMVAIQDGVMPTRNYQKYITKTTNIKDECRKCGENGETIEHVISGCRTMANEEYIKRHNNVAKIIHKKLASEYQLIKEKVATFKYEPAAVLENTRCRIMWDAV
jgi:hypothetical protein